MRWVKRSKPRGSTSTGIRCRQARPRQDVDKFEAQALASGGFDTADVPPRYRSSYFLHIWSNGYSAGYYAYPGPDARPGRVQLVRQNGGLTRANGQRFRNMVLSRGNTLDYAEMYRAFTGHDPSIQPYLDYYGFSDGGARRRRLPAAPAAAPGLHRRLNEDTKAMIRQLDDRP